MYFQQIIKKHGNRCKKYQKQVKYTLKLNDSKPEHVAK